MLGIIDYAGGNLSSVKNALDSLAIQARIVKSPEEFAGLDRLIFPGVGAFGDSVTDMDRFVFLPRENQHGGPWMIDALARDRWDSFYLGLAK